MHTILILGFALFAVYALSFVVTPLVAGALRFSYQLARPNSPAVSYEQTATFGIVTIRDLRIQVMPGVCPVALAAAMTLVVINMPADAQVDNLSTGMYLNA